MVLLIRSIPTWECLNGAGTRTMSSCNSTSDAPAMNATNGLLGREGQAERLPMGQAPAVFDTAGSPACTDRGSIMLRNDCCYECINCGAHSGCS